MCSTSVNGSAGNRRLEADPPGETPWIGAASKEVATLLRRHHESIVSGRCLIRGATSFEVNHAERIRRHADVPQGSVTLQKLSTGSSSRAAPKA